MAQTFLKKLNGLKIDIELNGTPREGTIELSLANRGIESIESLDGLVNLRKLNLSGNKLVKFPRPPG